MLLGSPAAFADPAAHPAEGRIALDAGLRQFRGLRSYFHGTSLARVARLIRRGSCRKAVREISRALERREVRDTVRGPAAFAAGLCAHRIGDFGHAASLLAEAVERYPQMRDQAEFLLGDSLLRAGEADRAVQLLERVARKHPSFDRARPVWA